MWVAVHGMRADGCSVFKYYDGHKVAGKKRMGLSLHLYNCICDGVVM